jgi:DNA repair protein RadC
MAGSSFSFFDSHAKRRSEDAILAQAETILLGRLQRRGRLRNPREAERFLRVRLARLRQEELHAVWLDGQHRVIACDVLARGTVDRAAVDARVVAQRALECNACAVILAHNHPSGEATPSATDRALTARLREALALFDVALLEHFVIGEARPAATA